MRVSLRTLCLPWCRRGFCSSVCCWAPARCWSRRLASRCSECACCTMPWCSAASPSSSKHAGYCFVYVCLFSYLDLCRRWGAECSNSFSIYTVKLIYSSGCPAAAVDNLFSTHIVIFLTRCACNLHVLFFILTQIYFELKKQHTFYIADGVIHYFSVL